MICFNCSRKYEINHFHMNGYILESFCSQECMDEDNARLVEGNSIIAKAEMQLSDINKLRLDISGPIGAQLGNMIHFGRKEITNENQE